MRACEDLVSRHRWLGIPKCAETHQTLPKKQPIASCLGKLREALRKLSHPGRCSNRESSPECILNGWPSKPTRLQQDLQQAWRTLLKQERNAELDDVLHAALIWPAEALEDVPNSQGRKRELL